MISQVSDYVQMQQHVYTEYMQILLLTMLQLKEKRKKMLLDPTSEFLIQYLWDGAPDSWHFGQVAW